MQASFQGLAHGGIDKMGAAATWLSPFLVGEAMAWL